MLTLSVTDNGRGAAANIDGHTARCSLLGMKEHIESAGGSLQAGPQLGGGFNYGHPTLTAVKSQRQTKPANKCASELIRIFAALPYQQAEIIRRSNRTS